MFTRTKILISFVFILATSFLVYFGIVRHEAFHPIIKQEQVWKNFPRNAAYIVVFEKSKAAGEYHISTGRVSDGVIEFTTVKGTIYHTPDDFVLLDKDPQARLGEPKEHLIGMLQEK